MKEKKPQVLGESFEQTATPESLHDDAPSAEKVRRKVPGANARTVCPQQWLNSSFRFIRNLGGHFAGFLRSFHRKPATSSKLRSTALMWPMPLPYPGAFLKSALNENRAFQRGVNLCVASLNWIHLRRPETCPPEIVLFEKLGKKQWQIVHQIEGCLKAWMDCPPITSEAMGRTAAKVEDIEAAVYRLGAFESQAFAVFDELFTDSSGQPRVKTSRSRLSPGLQKVSPGEFCGELPGVDVVVAKQIEADRLEFRGEPNFNPSPFLDSHGQAIFERPLSCALHPLECPCPIPQVKVHALEREKWRLLEKLDASGRLGVVRASEVLPGFQAGLFCVPKDAERDRLIFDSRPFNCLEQPPRRWIGSMAAASCLLDMQLPEEAVCLTWGTDLREFYYSFSVTRERTIRNSLLITARPWQIRRFRCYSPELENESQPLYLCLQTLAMGDSCAVELAQTAHIGILIQHGLLEEANLMFMNSALPRNPSLLGVVIDDLILFEQVLQQDLHILHDELRSNCLLDHALETYKALGLHPHEGKTFRAEPVAEFWGALFDGQRGYVRANLKRLVPILFATLGILKLGVTTVSLLEVLLGAWTSIFLFKRRMLSLVNLCYSAVQHAENRRQVLKLSEDLKSELLLFVTLSPLACTFLKARNNNRIYASDASSWGLGVCSAVLPSWLRGEVHRHRLRKSSWVRLLSPLKALKRVQGCLGADEELPDGSTLPGHPLFLELLSALPFDEDFRKKTKVGQHINIGELQALAKSEQHAAGFQFPNRTMYVADSQVALGAWIKGRSSSIGLNQILQDSLPIHLGCGVISNGAFVPSAYNVADDPTRHREVRAPCKEPLQWLPEEFPDGERQRLVLFDTWLSEHVPTVTTIWATSSRRTSSSTV